MRGSIVSIFFMASLCAIGQPNSPKYSNEFLALGVGARSFGLGMSSVAFVDDVTAGYWNPAALMQVNVDYQLGLMHASYFAGIANYDYGGFVMGLENNSKIGLSIIRFSVDDIPDTRFLFDANGAINYDNLQFFSAADHAALFSYARSLPFLGGINAGGSMKIIYRNVGDFSTAWGFGLDLGLQKDWKNWQFGLSVRDAFGTFNSWSHNTQLLSEIYQVTGNDIPVNTTEVTLPRLIIGAARSFSIKKFSVLGTLELDATFDGRRNTVLNTNVLSVDPHGGVEVGYDNLVFLRFGASQIQKIEEINGGTDWKYTPTGGIGFKIKEVFIDYALTDIGDQAEGLYSHVFSLKVDFYNAKE